MSGYRQRGAQLWRTVVLSAVSALVLGTFVVPATPAAAVGPLPQTATAPAAPMSVKATPGNAQTVVTWVAPSTGGSAITGYTVTSSPDGITATTTGAKTATLNGLTNGTAYTFTVTATNAIGTGPASAPSTAVTPAAPPGAPTSVTASPGNTKAVVTWTAPTDTGGSAITGYTVTASPGGKTATSTGATTATVTGLINGTAYTFMVTAKNAVSTGSSSTPSAAITPAGAPAAPTSVTATAGNASASVSWVAPSDNGGSTITGYTVTASPGGKTATTTGTTSATVLALTNGTAYTFTVKATTSGGTSIASAASSAVTPTGLPGAPTSVAAVGGDGQATVAWNAPSNGGTPITGYTVTSAPGGWTATTSGTTATVLGLTDGTAYTFTVVATNANGPGPTSTPSAAITPLGPPSAPTSVSAVPGNAKAVVSWTAPSSNGGSAVTGYTITASPGGQSVTAGAAATSATVTGLTNGTAYTFTVTAKNARVTGAASTPSAAVTPAAPPGAATGVTAIAGNGQASVSWVAPASNGDSPIIKYTVTSSPGGLIATTSGATNVVVTGLTNGTSYTFKVVAANAVSAGAASSASAAVVPVGAPGAPSSVAAVPGNGQAKVSWSKPVSNGGSTITAYTVTASPGGQTATTTGATSATITGLTNGTAYTFTVTATNAQGTSGSSVASAPVTPAMLPGAPTGVGGISRDASVAVSWTAPASDGGSPITGYTVTATPGGSKTTTNGATNVLVTGLTNGTAYTFKVTATNAIGTGPSSAASAAVTPLGPPGAPTGVTATAGNGDASVSWTPPVATGGAPITGYTILVSPAGTQATVGNITSAVVAGLINGTAYTFTVEATNRVGTGIASAPSASVTPAGPPSAPTDVAAVASDSQATVSWTPASANGSPITQYTVTVDPGGGATVTTGGAPDAVISGLTDGTEYTFTVTATNALGTSPASSPSAPVLPGGFTIPLTHGVARISASTDGADTSVLAVSNNGRFAVFGSTGVITANVVRPNLVFCPEEQLDVRDNSTGSIVTAGEFCEFGAVAVSDDGRYITYREPTVFVPSGNYDVSYVDQFDVVTGNTTPIVPVGYQGYTDNSGQQSADVGVSSDGRYVVYQRDDSTGNCPNQSQPVVWDRTTGVSTTLPICTNGALALSADGSTITSYAYDPQGNDEVFAWNRSGAVLGEVSVGRANAPLVVSNGNSLSLSADGNDVAFTATVGADGSFENAPFFGGGYGDAVAMRDLSAGFTSAVPYPRTNSVEFVQASSPSVSADGQHVAFVFLAGQSNEDGGNPEVLVTNMHTGTEQQADVTSTLALPNGGTQRVVLSGNARYIEFSSYASNIAPGDNNGNADVFLRDLTTIPPVVPAGELRPGDAFCPVCQATAARLDPINTATGAYENNATDVSLPGAGVTFNMAREYSSDDTTIGEFGIGWQANLTANLSVLADGDAQINAGTGAAVIFHVQPDGTFVAPPEVRATLTHLSNGDWQLATNTQVVSLFDANGRLISQVDRTGLGLTYAYDGSGKLASVTDAEGRVTTFTRGTSDAESGLITAVHVSDGRSWTYSYAFAADGTTPTLTSVTDPSVGVTTYTYDSNATLATVTDPNGHQVVAVTYSDGRVSSLSEAASGAPGSYSFNANTGTAVTTDALGGAWADTYVGNELISETDPLGDTTQYLYDSAGNKTAVTDPVGNTTTYTYDANGNVLTQTDPRGGVTTSTYDANNNLLSQTDPLGRTTSYSYDSSGQKVSETDPAGGVTRWTYTSSGQQASQTDPNGNTTSYTYDAAGNQISRTDPMGRVTTFTYDSSGNQLTQTDPMGRTTTDTYDSLGRLLTETDPLGRETVNTYDAVGNLASVTTAAGTPQSATTTNTYDAANRLLTTTDPLGRVTTNAYDAVGHLISTTDPAGDMTSSTYDLAGRKIGVTKPNGNVTGADPSLFTTTYSFDAAGHEIGTSQPLGGSSTAVTSTAYDADGRGTASTDADGNVTQNVYDADGELTQVTDPTGAVTANAYDSLGRKISTTDPMGRTTTFGYDADGNQTSMTDPTGAMTTATFDADNEQVTQVAADGYAAGATPSDFTTSYEFDADGEQTSVTDPLGQTSETTFDADREQTSTTDATGAVTTYVYDSAGNQTSTTKPDGTKDIETFDLAGQVVSSADAAGDTTSEVRDQDGRTVSSTDPTGAVTSSTFDADGNQLTSTSPNGGVTTNVYDNADRTVSSINPTGGVTTYTYDANGKQTSTTDPDGNTTGTKYDADGRVVATVRGDGTKATSAYDGAGELVSYTQPYDAAPGATPAASTGGPVPSPAAPDAPTDPTTVAVAVGPNAVSATWAAPSDSTPADYTVTVSSGTQLIAATVVPGNASSASLDGVPAGAADVLTVQPAGGGTAMVSPTFAVTGASSTYSSQVLADAPVAYYRLGDAAGADGAADLSGHNDTALPSATGTTFGSAGAIATDTDTAVAFSGGSLQDAAVAGLPAGNSDRSVEAWFATTSTGDETVATWGAGALGEQYSVAINGGNQIRFDAGGGQTASITSPQSLADGHFHQLVLTYSGATNTVAAYVDGQLIGADQQTAPLTTTVDATGFTIGSDSAGANSFAGGLDEVAIYSNALSSARVLAHFAAANLAALSTTTYTYNGAGHKATETDPDGRVTAYGYDAAGQLTTITDAAGRVTTQRFDAAGRMTDISYSDGITPNVTYTYDPAGRRTSMRDGSGTTTYTYNNATQVTSVVDGSGAAIGYRYDSLGRVSGLTYPDGRQISRGYDASSRLTSVTDWNAKTTRFGFDGDGNLTTTTLPNGVVSTTTVDAADRTSGITVANGDTSLAAFGYSYSPGGQQTGTTDTLAPATSNTYGYTPNNQLVGASGNPQAYAYDGSGNITALPDGAALTYDQAGQLITSNRGNALSSYAFDSLGNRIGTTTGTTRTIYSYDQANRLTTVTTGTSTWSYTYNGTGLRATAATSGSTTDFTWDTTIGKLSLLLSDESNDYLYGPNDEAFEQADTTSGATTYLSQDAIGSIRLVTDGDGTTVGTSSYDPYGNQLTRTGAVTSPLGYAGQYTDATELIYLRARYYDPATAAMLTTDPDIDSTHAAYEYGDADPLTASDPTGHRIEDEYSNDDLADWIYFNSPVTNNKTLFNRQLLWGSPFNLEGRTFWDTPPTVDSHDNHIGQVCYGADACNKAYLYNNGHPNDLPGARFIAATYCRTNYVHCQNDSVGYDGGLRQIDDLKFLVVLDDLPCEAGAETSLNDFAGLSRAAEYGIQPYSELRAQLKGTGLQAHHLLEQRFANILGQAPSDMLSIAVTQSEHTAFTNAWRRAIPYGQGTQTATTGQITAAARQIYAKFPAILRALGLR